MSRHHSFDTRRLVNVAAVLLSSLLVSVTVIGCGNSGPEQAAKSSPDDAHVLRTPTPPVGASQSPAKPSSIREGELSRDSLPGNLGAIEKITKDAGRVSRVSTRSDGPPIVVFEEMHPSRAGQVEIVLMLVRLYREHGMRHLALEGYVKGTSANTKWFHTIAATVSQRRLVATQLLEDGEISCAEYMSLVLPDVTLHPIEDAREYDVKVSERATAAGRVYLFRIAARQLGARPQTPEQLKKLKELQEQNEPSELIDYVIELDPWCSEKAKLLSLEDQGVQVEELLETLNAIEKKAMELKADVDAEERKLMEELKGFFEARGKASKTMVAATVKIAQQSPGTPTAMVIGAAHRNQICELFEKDSRTYVVITPHSLRPGDKTHLSKAAFNRKHEKLSVDETQLGALLDDRPKPYSTPSTGRKKPPPNVLETWFQAKAELALVTSKIAAAAAGRGEPPPPREPPFGLSDDPDFRQPHIRVIPESIERDGQDVIFRVVAFPDDEKKRREFWIRANYVGPGVDTPAIDISSIQSLEELLGRALERVRAGKPVEESVNDDLKARNETKRVNTSAAEGPPLIRISTDTIIKASTDKGAIKEALTTG